MNNNSKMVDMPPAEEQEGGDGLVSQLVGNGIHYLHAQGWSEADLINYIKMTTSKGSTPATLEKKSNMDNSVTDTSMSDGFSVKEIMLSGDREETLKERPHINDGMWFTLVYLGSIIFFITVWIVGSIQMTLEDGHWYRCLWFVVTPLYIVMAMLPFRVAIFNPLILLGSWNNINKNSTFHSAIASPRPEILPPMCVQMPVYKEAFDETIFPSLENIFLAIKHYRACGGSCYMFINDDGLQLIDEEKRNERLEYYHANDIAYIARPPPSDLARHGLFKKASNMNFCLNFALELAEVEEAAQGTLSKAEAIQKVCDSRPYNVMAGGPIDMLNCENILIVDSDTRVPEDCMINTVGEFALNRSVGFIQHMTAVLRVEDNYWEDMLAHFTWLLYFLYIPSGTSNGEPAPLVGHNATLNWSAVKEVSWFDEEVGYRKFWSESHVSEDFDLSLRLQSKGYIGRYATYCGDGFQEGVSVTVHDEIKKLKKFAFGSGEMLFNPIQEWCCKGVFCDLIKTYTKSNAPLHARIGMVGYLFSYIAMAYGVFMLPFSFYGAMMDSIDFNLPTPFEIMTGTIIIFAILGNGTVIIMTFLLGYHSSILMAVVNELKQLVPFGLFFMGLMYHIFTSFSRYMLKMKAEWGATVKELEDADYSIKTFVTEIYNTIKAYWDMYLFMAAICGFFFYIFNFGPEWLHWDWVPMMPFVVMIVSHCIMPIVMNPTCMRCIYMPPFILVRWIFCRSWRRGQAVDEDQAESVDDLETLGRDDPMARLAKTQNNLQEGNLLEPLAPPSREVHVTKAIEMPEPDMREPDMEMGSAKADSEDGNDAADDDESDAISI